MSASSDLQRGIDDMAIMNTKHLEKFAVAEAQISSLQDQLARTASLQATTGEGQLEIQI